MTKPTTTTSNDTGSEPLWMRCGKNGDELVRWEDLTDNENLAAIAEHSKLYGVETGANAFTLLHCSNPAASSSCTTAWRWRWGQSRIWPASARR
jgi:hypothetical protein